MLVETYVDTEETLSLDQRLKVGEALLKTIEGLEEAFVEDVAKLVGEAMIGVAGRRAKQVKKSRMEQEGVPGEDDIMTEAEQELPASDDDEPKDEVNERLQKMLEGWEGKDGEEDVRIRTSALSILGVAIETNIAGVGSPIVSTAVDLAISILKIETSTDKAISRRAAVLLIMSLIRALDKADEEGKHLGFGFAGENLKDVIQVLQYVQTMDSDDVVVGHIREVLEGLQTWQSKSLLRMSRQENLPPSFGKGGARLAGLSVDPEGSMASRPRIEEIE